eukprot:CAMPEP_0202922160 /NCGR_PEP_ID=MMETSP1392-20130828/77779_1 /ASSEMBLY_ACC=CAM_ASM_000868 /TAXON_ID=225041 /ORGANISM="Chlamydomonas chlamydogama, Strain SAG 11-48b" /LENGTH=108 /DNA_ID=CAMNT_0049615773 /DNA_START=439 /DNA_END=764 /DNA_ORIENTATION=+
MTCFPVCPAASLHEAARLFVGVAANPDASAAVLPGIPGAAALLPGAASVLPETAAVLSGAAAFAVALSAAAAPPVAAAVDMERLPNMSSYARMCEEHSGRSQGSRRAG